MTTSNKKKICYIISGVDYSLGFLWLSQNIDKEKYEVSFIFLSKSKPSLFEEFANEKFTYSWIKCNSKLDYISIFFRLAIYFIRYRPSIVHAHLIEAGLISIPASFFVGVKKRIYTRHHATYNIYYYPHMVKYDKLINYFSTHIIAISNNVAQVLIQTEKTDPSKVHVIPHGFELSLFETPIAQNIEKLRLKYNPQEQKPVIGVISRFIELKGLQYILPAFKKLLVSQPNALLIMANATGNYKKEIDKLLQSIPKKNYITIEFEKDLFSLYKLFDLFIHVPINDSVEAFGQVYVEALAAGIPSVFTLSGIARDFIQHEKNALIVNYKSSDEIFQSICTLINNTALRNQLIEDGRNHVNKMFSFDKSLVEMYKIYD